MTSNGRHWLVVGHGSVGSFITRRLAAAGIAAVVLDPAPRIPVASPHRLMTAAPEPFSADYVISCVPPPAAGEVPALIRGLVGPSATFFEWNTVAPAIKQAIRDETEATTIDVALLDSLDGENRHPSLAVSGLHAVAGAAVLTDLGYDVTVVGDEVGQAAQLKYLRSVFMKGLEGLVLEYSALAAGLDDAGVVRGSLASNLGSEFLEFVDLLLVTDRVHARRRSRELTDAVATFADIGATLRIAPAAASMIAAAADAWAADSAPPADAPVADLTKHLQRTLWHPAST